MYLKNEQIDDANVKEQLKKKLLEMKAPDTAITNTGMATPRRDKKLVDVASQKSMMATVRVEPSTPQRINGDTP